MISDDVVEVRCCGLYCVIEISDGSIAAQKDIILTRCLSICFYVANAKSALVPTSEPTL